LKSLQGRKTYCLWQVPSILYLKFVPTL